MPQYVPSQFTAGMGTGAQLMNNAMDQSARAVAAEAAQAYATADYQNKLQDQIQMEREYFKRGINPKTGANLLPFQMNQPDTYGAQIMQGIYDYNLQRGNVQPGQPGQDASTLTPLRPGAQAWITPNARFPGVPSAYANAPGTYNQQLLPMLRSGQIVPFTPPPDQSTRQGQ